MVAPVNVYSQTVATVHDCAHLDTCEYSACYSGDYFRICRTCGQKDQTPSLSHHHFSVLDRPRDFVRRISREDYLAIERSFDQKKPEYRERVLRQLREALMCGAVNMANIEVVKDHSRGLL